MRVRMFTLVMTTGQFAGAMAAIGVLLLGIWKYVIQPARKVVKVYNSIGDQEKPPNNSDPIRNRPATVFELLHGINSKIGDVTAWRNTVDDTLAFQNRTLTRQAQELQAIGASVEVLIERHDAKS